ncbi:MAG: OsmC family protein [Thermoplasmata archaeon]|nr:OsmC family protein [Thermoplasmata archaeon]
MEVEIIQVNGLALMAKASSGHWIPMDTSSKVGGHEGAATPMELVLMGLCGCTAMDVISILDKMHVPYGKITVTASAERAEEHPKKFDKVHIVYTLTPKDGEEIPTAKVEKAIRLSEDRYCGAAANLRPSVDITSEYKIVE